MVVVIARRLPLTATVLFLVPRDRDAVAREPCVAQLTESSFLRETGYSADEIHLVRAEKDRERERGDDRGTCHISGSYRRTDIRQVRISHREERARVAVRWERVKHKRLNGEAAAGPARRREM